MNNKEWELCGKPVVERVKNEIQADVRRGLVPVSVASFAALHDHVDANEYGGACEVDENGIGWWDMDRNQHEDVIRFWNRVQNEVDQWLKEGGLREPAQGNPQPV